MSSQLNLVLYSLGGGFLPIVIWLWFWLREDKLKPEPIRLILRVFLAGSLLVFLAYFLERSVCKTNWLVDACANTNRASWAIFNTPLASLLIVWSGIEEVLKFLVVYLLVFRRPEFDEPVDAMIYMITAALGFAALENSLFLFNGLFEVGDSATFFLTGNLRFLGANLTHVVSSAIVGGIIGLSFYVRMWQRWFYLALGLITAILLHALFNLFIIASDGTQLFKILSLLWLFTILIIWLFEKVKTITCLKTNAPSSNA